MLTGPYGEYWTGISSFVILVAVIGNIPPGACQRLWERTRQQIPNSEAVQEEAP